MLAFLFCLRWRPTTLLLLLVYKYLNRESIGGDGASLVIAFFFVFLGHILYSKKLHICLKTAKNVKNEQKTTIFVFQCFEKLYL